jgi:ribosomal protein S18 acetylase RimI-like enzyme
MRGIGPARKMLDTSSTASGDLPVAAAPAHPAPCLVNPSPRSGRRPPRSHPTLPIPSGTGRSPGRATSLRGRLPSIRRYRPGDRAAVYEICLRTGDAGEDARGLFTDPDLPGHVWLGPYLELCPDLAFVVEDDDGAVVGYAVGALDTRAFVAAYRERWLPRFATSHPTPVGEPTTHDERALDALHRPETLLAPELPGFPSHMHLNLLPAGQGHGHGRALIDTMCDALRAAGSPGVHLGVRRRNERARGFYAHIGLELLAVEPDGVFFGRSLL